MCTVCEPPWKLSSVHHEASTQTNLPERNVLDSVLAEFKNMDARDDNEKTLTVLSITCSAAINWAQLHYDYLTEKKELQYELFGSRWKEQY